MKAQSVLRVIEWNFISKLQHVLFFYPNRLIGAYFGSKRLVVKLAGTYKYKGFLYNTAGTKKNLEKRVKGCHWKIVKCVVTFMLWNVMQQIKNRLHLYPLRWKEFHKVLLTGKARCRDCIIKPKTKIVCV